MFELIDVAVALVPLEWWPVIGMWAARALALNFAVVCLLWLAVRVDKRDGVVDWPRAGVALAWAARVLEALQAVLNLSPVRLPDFRGLRKLRDLRRVPHPDDLAGLDK